MKLPPFRKPAVPIILAVILLIAVFFRFWNLPNTLQFQGDQGRDALIVSRIFKESDLVFIGPVTSVGNMYLGPLYYYFMLPFLWLTYPSPLGPAYAIAVIGVLSVYLTYRWGKELVCEQGSLIASFLFAVSATAVFFSRFSWNPNPAPLISLVMIYGTYKAWKSHPKYWLLVGLAFSILIQLHYLTLLSLGGAGIIWLLQCIELIKHRSQQLPKLKHFMMATLGAVAIFLVSLLPLVLFDWKHEWLNGKALANIFVGEEAFISEQTRSLSQKVVETLKETHGRSLHILFETTIGEHRLLNTTLLVLVLGICGWLLRQTQRPYWSGLAVILAYLVTGILGTALYEHTVFDHYIAYLFPVAFLVLGVVLSWLNKRRIGVMLSLLFILFFTGYNLKKMPIQSSNWTIFEMQTVTDSINQVLEPGEAYSLILLSESKDLYAQNYRYFLSTTDTPPLPPERAGEAETLVVINEEHVENVGYLPIYEIATFPEKNPSEVYTIDHGPEIIIFRKQ
jgi:4-amino-4-deoxy-L-arabinose transferase-like glycosyltransferase